MNLSRSEGREPHARPAPKPFSSSNCRVLRTSVVALTLAAAVLLGSCSYVERGRQVADVAVATTHQLNLTALVEAQEERIRVRKSRCYNPMLTPATIADAALDPRLGKPWIEELLRDCPKFGAFIAQLVVTRTQLGGTTEPEVP